MADEEMDDLSLTNEALMGDATEDGSSSGDLGGEASGEVAASSDPFFVSKRAAAVLKHGILNRYLTPFVAKVGSTSAGNRVALFDGYAGPGRYDDGTAGSPALLAKTAADVASYRKVECHFVEQKARSFQRLRDFLETEGAQLAATAYRGRVEQHLDTIVAATAGVPLLAYLDPFGFGVPFEDVVRLLQRYSGRHDPPTEVLLNFTANGIRRAGGLVAPGREASASEEKTLQRGDVACGGSWWRDVVRQADVLEDAVQEIASTYSTMISEAAGTGYFGLPVRKREHHKPVYYLLFFSKHRDGMWLFNEAVSGASRDWRECLAPPPWQPDPDLLFDLQTEPSFEEEEVRREAQWIVTIEQNVRQLLTQGPFIVDRQMTAVYKGVLGEAREKHLRRAIKNLHRDGVTASNGVGSLQQARIEPA